MQFLWDQVVVGNSAVEDDWCEMNGRVEAGNAFIPNPLGRLRDCGSFSSV